MAFARPVLVADLQQVRAESFGGLCATVRVINGAASIDCAVVAF